MLSIIQVGHDDASDRYIRNKIKAIDAAGMVAKVVNLPKESSTKDVLDCIQKVNEKDGCTAIMVQLPLPLHIDKDLVLRSVPVEKDIDGLNPHSDYQPLTPCAIMRWLEKYKLQGRNIVILGKSDLVGKPLANMLMDAGATVTVLNSKTSEWFREIHCQLAGIVISAVGLPNTFKKSYVSNTFVQTVIDVGINKNEEGKLCGDVSQGARELIEENHGICTPVPGGVGKWTVNELVLRLKEMENRRIHNEN